MHISHAGSACFKTSKLHCPVCHKTELNKVVIFIIAGILVGIPLLAHAGEVPATQDRLPLILVTYIVFSEKQKAYDFEKYPKTGSGRAVMNKRLV